MEIEIENEGLRYVAEAAMKAGRDHCDPGFVVVPDPRRSMGNRT